MNAYYNDPHRYDDIIDLPHHQSKTRPRMPARNRAAQFAPFAALSGYQDAIDETQRHTDERISLEADKIDELNEKLLYINEHLQDRPQVSVTYFKPDAKKQGGSYLTAVFIVKKIDVLNKTLITEDGLLLKMEDIIDIEIGS